MSARPAIGATFVSPRGRVHEVIGWMVDMRSVVLRGPDGLCDVAHWQLMTPENGWQKGPPMPSAAPPMVGDGKEDTTEKELMAEAGARVEMLDNVCKWLASHGHKPAADEVFAERWRWFHPAHPEHWMRDEAYLKRIAEEAAPMPVAAPHACVLGMQRRAEAAEEVIRQIRTMVDQGASTPRLMTILDSTEIGCFGWKPTPLASGPSSGATPPTNEEIHKLVQACRPSGDLDGALGTIVPMGFEAVQALVTRFARPETTPSSSEANLRGLCDQLEARAVAAEALTGVTPDQTREMMETLRAKGWISEGKGRWHHPDFDDDCIHTFAVAWAEQDNTKRETPRSPLEGSREKKLHEIATALLGVVTANRLAIAEQPGIGMRYLADLEKRARAAIDAYSTAQFTSPAEEKKPCP